MLELLEPGRRASIERDVFPRLVGDGLYGYVGDGYWLDIGTPERYLQGTFDILEGAVGPRSRAHGRRSCASSGAENAGGSSRRARRARLPDRRRRAGRRRASCSSAGVHVGAGTTVERAVVLQRRRDRRATARCAAASSPPARGSATTRTSRASRVLGEGVDVGAGNVITNGARLFPGVDIPDGGILF